MSEVEKAVHKSTSSKAVQPKRKHVRAIVIEVWNENSARSFFTEILKRPLEQNEIVCFKALTVVHKVLQEGPRQALIDGYFRLTWLDSLREHWQRQPVAQGYGELTVEYAVFIKDKILFHHRHAEFEGDFSLEKFKKYVKLENVEMDKCIEFVSHLMDLQESVFKLQRSIIEPRNVNDVKAGALIPLVLESYGIYTMITHFLTKMVEKVDSMDVIQYLIERFYSQYMILRDFYVNAAAMRSVSSIIAVPSLPSDPPQFTLPATTKPRQPKSRKGTNTPTVPRREENLVDPNLLVSPAPAPPVPTPTPIPAPLPAQTFIPTSVPVFAPAPLKTATAPIPTTSSFPPDMWSTFAPAPSPTNFQPFATAAPQFSQPIATATTPTASSSQSWVTFESAKKSNDPFSDLLTTPSPRNATSSTPPAKPAPVAQSAPVTQVTATPAQATSTPAPSAQASQTEKTRVITKVVTRTVTDTTEINKLKERIEELEKLNASLLERCNLLAQQQVDHEKLNAGLGEKSNQFAVQLAELQKINSELVERSNQYASHQADREKANAELTERNDQFAQRLALLEHELAAAQQARIATQEQLDDALDARERDRWDRAVADISNSKEAVEGLLSLLDSPTNLGNPEATASLLVEDVTGVAQTATRLLQASRAGVNGDPALSQKELLAGLSAAASALRSLFNDAKGTSRRLEDTQVSQHVLSGARQIGTNALALFETLRMLGGQPQDEDDNRALSKGLATLQASLQALVETAKEVELKLQEQERKAIEVQEQEHERVEVELQVRQQQEQHGLELDDLAEKELRAAAKTIEDAANALIAARASRKPRAPNDNKPDVAEAILEAAMAIASATSTLVSSAATAQRERAETGRARAAQGVPYKRDPTWAEGLISAAKAVAAATSALVGVANDAVQGKTGEEGLIAVSKAVAAATAQLVASARAKAEDSNSATQQKLSAAARSVSHATSLLVAAAKAAAMQEEAEEVTDYSKMSATGFKVKEMEQQMKVLRLEKELQKARNDLLGMRKSEYAGVH